MGRVNSNVLTLALLIGGFGEGLPEFFPAFDFCFSLEVVYFSFSGNFISKKLNRVPGWFAVSEINLTMEIISFRVVLSSEFFLENAGSLIKGGSPIGF